LKKYLPLINKIIALIAVFAFLAPVIFLGGDTEMRIHDQLDSYNVYEVLVDSGKTFTTGSDVTIENIMNGLPRDCFPSGYNMVLWLIIVFGAKGGFFVNYILVHITGFVGMLLLLNKVINKNDPQHFNWLIAAAFAILPVNSLAGISLTGIPLVFYAFYNLGNKTKIASSFLIILLFCLYSSLIHAGIFVMIFLGCIFLYQLLKGNANLYYFFGMIAMATAFALIESNLIKSILFSKDYVTHRQDFVRELSLNIKGVAGVGFLNVLNGNYGSANYFGLPVLLLAIGCLVYGLYTKSNVRKILATLLIIVSCGIFIALLDWKSMNAVYNKFHFLDAFNLRRFHFLLPVLMFVLLAFCVGFLLQKKEMLALPLSLLCCAIIGYHFYLNKEYNRNPGNMTFNEFFSKPLFRSIDQFIAQPKESYRIVSLGIEPAVAQCNGFYALDSYQNNYSLGYKNNFRKIIEPELNKYPKEKKYFDDWGNRCVIPYHPLQVGTDLKIENLSIDTPELRKLGGKYIFSAASIQNKDSLGLKELKVFSGNSSPYTIYLYQVL
jgi:hypothetical protein